MDQQFMDLKCLAQRCGLSRRTLRALVHDPTDPLPAYRVGGKLLFEIAQVEKWIRRHRVTDVEIDLALDDLAMQSLSSLGKEKRSV